MRKFIVNSSLLIVHCFFLLSIINYLLPLVYAADSTPSADPLRPPGREAGQSDSEASIKTKLEELKKEIASKAAKLKQTVNQKLKDKAYIGKIKQKSNNSIALSTTSNPKLISINQDTVFESKVKGKTKYSQKNLADDDYIAALGDVDETGVLTAKKIILLPATTALPKTYLWGQVISISDKLITLKDKDSKNVTASVASVAGIKLNAFVILTGNKDKNDVFKAGFVYVIPQGGVIKPKKTATPSAKIATPSAKPKSKN